MEDQERVGDNQDGRFPHYAEEFTSAPVTEILGIGSTTFERMQQVQDASGGSTHAPFANQGEWELAQWLIKNVNQHATDEFLKLLVVSVHS